MKLKFILSILLVFTAVTSSAQVSVGLRDTRYANIGYTFLDNWNVELEHSLYSEEMKLQYVRLYASYTRSFGIVSLKAQPYIGMTYSNSYSSEGCNIEATVSPLKWLDIRGGFTPHHDSGLGYKSLYLGTLKLNINNQISIIGSYTNRPEYRMPERRIRAGLLFKVKNLSVQPELSIPAGSGEGHFIRVLASMNYTF